MAEITEGRQSDGRNVRSCFQLYADGHSLNGWRFRMRSKAVFGDRDAAERYAPEFRAMCVDHQHFECAVDDENLKITVVELEFYD